MWIFEYYNIRIWIPKLNNETVSLKLFNMFTSAQAVSCRVIVHWNVRRDQGKSSDLSGINMMNSSNEYQQGSFFLSSPLKRTEVHFGVSLHWSRVKRSMWKVSFIAGIKMHMSFLISNSKHWPEIWIFTRELATLSDGMSWLIC